MPEQSNKPQKQSDNNIDINPYLDTSNPPSIKASYGGGGPYLVTSENPSIKSNDAGGSPYLDTSEHFSTQE